MFAERELSPRVDEMDRAEKMDPSIVKGLFANGLMGIEIDREHGGAGMSFTGALLAVEELARVDPSVSVMVDVQNTLVNTVLKRYGSKKLQEAFLPRLAANTVGSFCLSEASSGSDAFAMRAGAKKEGSGLYRLTGEKLWITNSDYADVFLIFANLDPEKGYRGITCFVATREQGIRIGKKESKLGIRASGTCAVEVEGAQVPDWQIVGEPGKGYKIAIECLNEGRIGIAAQMLGLARGAWAKTLPYLFQRRQFDTLIGDFQVPPPLLAI